MSVDLEVKPMIDLLFRALEDNAAHSLPLKSTHREIWYLRLESGGRNDPPGYYSYHSSLEKPASARVSYEALSYRWGSVDDTVTISVNFPTARGATLEPFNQIEHPYHITRSLAAALASVRLPHAARVLWIDALCIEQSDPKEKTR
jgi:hypothetical protein